MSWDQVEPSTVTQKNLETGAGHPFGALNCEVTESHLVGLLGSYGRGPIGRAFVRAAALGGVLSPSCFGLDEEVRGGLKYLIGHTLKGQLDLVFSQPKLQIFVMHSGLLKALGGTHNRSQSDLWNLFDRCLLLSAAIEDSTLFGAGAVNWKDCLLRASNGSVWRYSSLREGRDALGAARGVDGVLCYAHEAPYVSLKACVPAWGKSRFVDGQVRRARGHA